MNYIIKYTNFRIKIMKFNFLYFKKKILIELIVKNKTKEIY